MKLAYLTFFLICLVNQANSQSSQIRAQARYYSAKSQFEKGDYASTLISVKESKEILGGTNFLVQYLHIMAAYNNGNYKEAQTEMDKYFKLLDKKEAPISFSRSVEELSSDETTDLVKLLDKIDQHVADNTEEKVRIEKERKQKAEEIENEKRRKEEEWINFRNSKLSYFEENVEDRTRISYRDDFFNRTFHIRTLTYERNGDRVRIANFQPGNEYIEPIEEEFMFNLRDEFRVSKDPYQSEARKYGYTRLNFDSKNKSGFLYVKGDAGRIISDLEELKVYRDK